MIWDLVYQPGSNGPVYTAVGPDQLNPDSRNPPGIIRKMIDQFHLCIGRPGMSLGPQSLLRRSGPPYS